MSRTTISQRNCSRETIKFVKSHNKKVDAVVQNVNDEGIKLQKELKEAKQLRMKLGNYLIAELMKPQTYYNRLLDMEDNIKMYM